MDVDRELEVLAVVEHPLCARAATGVAPEDFGEGLFDREARIEEQLLGGAVAECGEHLIHTRLARHLDANAADAAEPHPGQRLVQAPHLGFGAAELHVDPARDVFRGAAEVSLLVPEACLQALQVVA